MSKEINELIDYLFNNLNLVDSKEIPNIDLYMDQVTTFMDSHLRPGKKDDEDKPLTKTMINNYAKNALLPPPTKKKYNKEHLIMLILIYYLKNVTSINNIKKVLDPIAAEFFGKKEGVTLTDIYDGMNENVSQVIDTIKEDVFKNLEMIDSAMHVDDSQEDSEDKQGMLLEKFYTVALLTFDVTIKKQIIEGIIESIEGPATEE